DRAGASCSSLAAWTRRPASPSRPDTTRRSTRSRSSMGNGMPERCVPLARSRGGTASPATRSSVFRSVRARPTRRIPSTYVPARNTILLSVALGYAESHRLGTIYLGANAIDYSGYPDCRPEYFRAFERLARLATKAGVEGGARIRVETPLLRRSKADIVRLGERLGVPWALTWSCYAGGRTPCGTCDACRLRRKGFAEAG